MHLSVDFTLTLHKLRHNPYDQSFIAKNYFLFLFLSHGDAEEDMGQLSDREQIYLNGKVNELSYLFIFNIHK